MRRLTLLDNIISQIDQVIRTVDKGVNINAHPQKKRMSSDVISEFPVSPTAIHADHFLSTDEKRQSAALMRINHCGEVCAQALYQAQALMARDPRLIKSFQKAALDEESHLHWCEVRLESLGGRKSYLNPIWYSGSFLIGILAGLAGDKISLGFLAETEHQVAKHLEHHLSLLPQNDKASREVLEKMREDELSHATHALDEGGITLPTPIPTFMAFTSKIMTSIAKVI